MSASKDKSKRTKTKLKIELVIFLAVLVAIAGVFLLTQQTTSITGAVISTLPEEEIESPPVSEENSSQTNSSQENIGLPIEEEKKQEQTVPDNQPEILPIVEQNNESNNKNEEEPSLGIQGIDIQAVPALTLVLNTTNVSSNNTDVNLTAYNTTQTNGSSLKVIYNWIRNTSSIAVLNMPFEGINGTSYNNSWDYSGLQNHGNESGNIVWNSTGGYDGKGAYMFDQSNDYIDLGDRDVFKGQLCVNGCTFNAWINPRNETDPNSNVIIGRQDTTGQDQFFSFIMGTAADLVFTIYFNGSSGAALNCNVQGESVLNQNEWAYVTGRYNVTHTAIFINGTQMGATACGFSAINTTAWADSEKTFIGVRDDSSPTSFFNGTIDEVTIFNRSLSVEQIYALWQNKTNVIAAQETSRGENWSVQATPNNGTGDGNMVTSNNVTILNTKAVLNTLVLNTTNISSNKTDVNLTAHVTTSDIDNDSVKVIYNWIRNNTPIALSNIPFEGINGTANNNAWDYSGYGRSGSEVGGIIWNATSGYDGKGAYMFDGTNDYISVTVTDTIITQRASMFARIYVKENISDCPLGTCAIAGAGSNFLWELNGNTLVLYNYNVNTPNFIASAATLKNNTWFHVGFTYWSNNSVGNLTWYINGVESGSTQNVGLNGTLRIPTFRIGDDIGRLFNGTIDEFMIFNRTLSSEQIYALWQNQTNIITASETIAGENWSVQATPNDGFEDGNMVTSNNVTILNTAPNITTLVLNTTNPLTNNTNVNLTAYATTTDIDNDSIKVIYNWIRNGTSIALLNMPFEKINNTAINNTWDYSGLLNHGSATGNILWNATGGYDGKGAHHFDGTNDGVSISTIGSLPTYTISSWLRTDAFVDAEFRVFLKAESSSTYFALNGSGVCTFITAWQCTNATLAIDQWVHVAVISNGDVYVNGVYNGTLPTETISGATGLNIGNRDGNIDWDGTIDEFMIFNRTLSAEQIYALFQNKTDIIVAQETLAFENWSVQATPNDGSEDGAMVTSNNVTILGDATAPTITINNPATNNTNYSTSNILFNATISDAAIAAVNFSFNNASGIDFNISIGNWSGLFNTTLSANIFAEGSHLWQIFATDIDGNVNTSMVINFTIDRTPPNVTTLAPSNGQIFNLQSYNRTFNASVFDNLTLVDSVYFSFDNGTGVDINITATNFSGVWVANYNVSSLSSGQQTVRIVANDTVGNINDSYTINFIINSKPAVATIVLNTTNPLTNDTNTNLTAYVTTSDADSDSVKVIYNWIRDTTPIALINMPFEKINGTDTNNAWDYSGFENNASENNGALWNATGGYDGKGVYDFDGTNDFLLMESTTYPTKITVAGWVKSDNISSSDQILLSYGSFMFGHVGDFTQLRFFANVQTAASVVSSAVGSGTNINEWHHIAVVYDYRFNSTNGNGTFYFDGIKVNSFVSTNNTGSTANLRGIGYYSGGNNRFFNGTIDELLLFNKTLSDEQVYALWQNQTNVITASETSAGENWSVQATPNDGTEDGAMVTSNNVTILGLTAPTITINNPAANNTNYSTSNILFNATISDAAIGAVNFSFNNASGNDFNISIGNWSGLFNTTLSANIFAEGSNLWQIFATDTDGNVNTSMVINFTIDRTPPNVTRNFINNPADNRNFSLSSNNQTFNASVFDNLTLVDSVYFWFDNGTGTDVNITGINNSGQWPVSYNVSALAEEKQGVRIVANDTVNNINSSFFFNFTVDRTPPNVTLNLGTANNLVSQFGSNFTATTNNRTFNASVFDALTLVDSVYFWFDNGTGTDINITGINNSGQWSVSYNVSAMAEQKQGVRIVANDTVNNINSSFFFNFTVDRTPPTVNITSPLGGATISSAKEFNATITDLLTEVNTVLFQFSNGTTPFNRTASNSSGTWNVSVDTTIIAEGALTVTVFANDTVGNMNSTQTLSLTVDNVAEAGAGEGSGGGGGGGGGGSSSTSRPAPEYVCGNGILENGEQCDSGEGCDAYCTCTDGYNSVKEIDCEILPFCGDGVVNQATEECDNSDLNGKTCLSYGYIEGKLSCTTDCTLDNTKCIAEQKEGFKLPTIKNIKETSTFKKYVELSAQVSAKGKEIASSIAQAAVAIGKAVLHSLLNYTIYWILSAILIVIIIIGLHIQDLPVPQFILKLRSAPKVKVEQPSSTAGKPIQKESPALLHWGKKNYIDLQQELKKVEKLITETPMPEQKNKILKLTSLRDSRTDRYLNKTKIQTSIEEHEDWIAHLLASGTPAEKVVSIIRNATSLDEADIKSAVAKARAVELLRKKYQLDQKALSELKEFIRKEKKRRTAPEQIIADLVQEGWDKEIIKLYVSVTYNNA